MWKCGIVELLNRLTIFLRGNPLILDEDMIAMGLPKHPRRSRTPPNAPTNYPMLEIDSSMIRRLILPFYDLDTMRRAKPAGAHGVEICWAVFNEQVVKVGDLVNTSFATRSPFFLDFNDEQRGHFAYFCLRWVNTRGVKGPFGEIVSAIIP
ncbi:MAG: hypothetical protein LBT48_02260 [Prevotellaceae bacterium]|jgi:hypothetical protein|nr:hypothetical protein [Prevotellaceae bacterium]